MRRKIYNMDTFIEGQVLLWPKIVKKFKRSISSENLMEVKIDCSQEWEQLNSHILYIITTTDKEVGHLIGFLFAKNKGRNNEIT